MDEERPEFMLDVVLFSRCVSPPYGSASTEQLRALVTKFTGTKADIRSGELFDVLNNSKGLPFKQQQAVATMVLFQDFGLCNRDQQCPKRSCRKWVRPKWIHDSRYGFHCACGKELSMFRRTFLEENKLALPKILGIIWEMTAWRNYTQSMIAQTYDMDPGTVSQFAIYVREAFACFNRYNPVILGGNGVRVFADEGFLGTKFKYHRGNPQRGLEEHDVVTGKKTDKKVMLLVLSEETSKNVVIYHIEHANTATIRPIFERHVLPGSVAHTDGAAVYRNIPTWGDKSYTHDWVNHSEGEFAKTDATGKVVSSNAVEGVISSIKRMTRKHNGFRYKRVWLALEEFVYHRNWSGSGTRADFKQVLRALGEYGTKDINEGAGHSLYYDYLAEWQKYCTNPAHIEKGECTCAAPVEVEEEDLEGDEEGSDAE